MPSGVGFFYASPSPWLCMANCGIAHAWAIHLSESPQMDTGSGPWLCSGNWHALFNEWVSENSSWTSKLDWLDGRKQRNNLLDHHLWIVHTIMTSTRDDLHNNI